LIQSTSSGLVVAAGEGELSNGGSLKVALEDQSRTIGEPRIADVCIIGDADIVPAIDDDVWTA
jgi:hypothetical protein